MKHSYLFVPGNRPERFAKAVDSGAGSVIIDLEDAVPPEGKAEARTAVCHWLSEHARDSAIWVRVNGTDTEFFADDVRALAGVPRAGVMLPKAETAEQLRFVAEQAGMRSVSIIALVESAQGIWNALEIARSPEVTRLAFGSVDFQLDTGIEDEDQGLLAARTQLVMASRIARLAAPIDGVTVEIGDPAQLARDVSRARALGFGAKLCIHPSQIAVVEQGFAPTSEELLWARSVVEAFEQAAGSAVRLQGKLIDLPVVERARRLLDSQADRNA